MRKLLLPRILCLALALILLWSFSPIDFGSSATNNTSQLYLFVRGLDNRIHYRSKLIPDGVWGSWEVIPVGTTYLGPAAAPDPSWDRIALVVRGTTGGLYLGTLSMPSETFGSWSQFSGDTPSRPVLAHVETSEGFRVVVRGMNDGIYTNEYPYAYWEGWSTLPGTTPDGPAATYVDFDLHVVVRGMDGGLWHYYEEYGTWHGWNGISGETESPPVLAATETGDAYMFLVVRGMDNRIYYKAWGYMGDGGWYGWDVLPTGATCDGPAAVVLDNKLHIVVRGMNDGLYYGYLDLTVGRPYTWSGWEFLEGETESPPVLVAYTTT